MSEYLKDMKLINADDEQKQAIGHPSNVVVSAGPGSGKTKVLSMKVAQILKEEVEYPRGLACFTFTNAAANEIKKRAKKYNLRLHQNTYIGTLDTFILTHIIYKFKDYYDSGLPELFDPYEHKDLYKGAANKLLENDYIVKVLESKFPYILIDEYQDTDNETHLLIKSLIEKTNIKFFIVGDVDQSIYSFRNTSPQYLREFISLKSFKHVVLRNNYRCERSILKSAKAVLSDHNRYKIDSSEKINCLFCYCPDGIESQVNRICDIIPRLFINGVKPNEICILYSTFRRLELMESILKERGVKYSKDGKSYLSNHFSRWNYELLDWVEKIALWLFTEEDISFNELFNYYYSIYSKKVKRSCLLKKELKVDFYKILVSTKSKKQSLKEWFSFMQEELELENILGTLHSNIVEPLTEFKIYYSNNEISVYDFINIFKAEDCIKLSTRHSAKGQEFKAVFIPDFENGIYPHYDAVTPEQIQEDRQLTFVCITRASEYCFVLFSGFYYDHFNRLHNNGVSLFWENLQHYCVEYNESLLSEAKPLLEDS